MNHKIICFGETLWDMLPSGKLPGGAPMNVAIHLKYNNYEPLVISSVGIDDLGAALLQFLKSKQVSTAYVQVSQTHLTGVVKVNVDNRNEVTYEIVEPVAWDYIQYEPKAAGLVKDSDVFVYGSLAARSATTRETLLHYLPLAKLKVFDVNLRPPHFTPERIQVLLQFADVLKLNHQELQILSSWVQVTGNEQQKLSYLQKNFNIPLLILTRGENGAAVLSSEEYLEHPGFKIEVEDTIGSGDAFLATFLSNYLQAQPLAVCLRQACLIGAYVATCQGATPQYTPQEVVKSFAGSII
ncbi:carbohydrate kinase [Adhaeribacter swui]|uniref:Carbohydrate kinase n=1 Tax=Adhaeribacter swui TaxID=2086471 RepID=A0A7G7GCU6_9BACT|nr:carbohydrate kinase [Adhaeribacter swui]QNF34980.1 carbohydrate kinase [Adhaeribacter swui]